MTVKELREKVVGKRIVDLEYQVGANVAYLIDSDGFGHEVSVEPSFDEDEA